MTDQTKDVEKNAAEANTATENTANAENAQPHFAIEKIYVKDASLELPNAPAIFLEQATPEVSIQLQTGGQRLDKDVFDASLTVTITSKIGDKTVFLIEVTQSGIFRIQNVPDEAFEPLLSIACPNILFPFAREVISDLSTRAGFAPIVLQPVNFEALYQARLAEAAKNAEKATSAEAATSEVKKA